jgi:hypothetical protein
MFQDCMVIDHIPCCTLTAEGNNLISFTTFSGKSDNWGQYIESLCFSLMVSLESLRPLDFNSSTQVFPDLSK